MDADEGHYRGYTENDFIKLLDLLSTIKGKFLLSCYSSELVTKYAKENNWHIKTIEKYITASRVNASGKKRKEGGNMVANYLTE